MGACGQCGEANAANARFCSACGVPLETGSPREQLCGQRAQLHTQPGVLR
ncbi:MAG: zinc ribbon domain-containing protein [Actinobacteria bacterium]|nr:zinc ribbon domain-containing protein [Actinomycetota bacterium]